MQVEKYGMFGDVGVGSVVRPWFSPSYHKEKKNSYHFIFNFIARYFVFGSCVCLCVSLILGMATDI